MSAEWVSVLDLQKALKHFGHDPGPLDGILGNRTGSALSDWIITTVYFNQGWSTTPSENKREVLVAPAAAAQVIEEAARAYDRRNPPASARRPATSAPLATATGAPFWRRDNIWAWAVVGLGVAATSGGVYWYGRKRRWFR